MGANKNLPGVIAMVAAAALFTVMDAGMKLLAEHYSSMQVTALRSLASLPLVYVFVAWRSSFAAMLRVRWPLHMARGALAIVMLYTFVRALSPNVGHPGQESAIFRRETPISRTERTTFSPADLSPFAQKRRFTLLHPDRKSTRLNSSHPRLSRMPSSA